MPREIIKEPELIEFINSKIQSYEDLKECCVSGIYTLEEPDENGCNWSLDYINSGGVPQEILQPVVSQVVSSLQEKYNVEE